MPAVKAHIVNRDEPIKFSEPIFAACGVEVFNPSPVFMFDNEFGQGATFNSLPALLVCRHCQKLEHELRYIYGILNGQELKHGEGQ